MPRQRSRFSASHFGGIASIPPVVAVAPAGDRALGLRRAPDKETRDEHAGADRVVSRDDDDMQSARKQDSRFIQHNQAAQTAAFVFRSQAGPEPRVVTPEAGGRHLRGSVRLMPHNTLPALTAIKAMLMLDILAAACAWPLAMALSGASLTGSAASGIAALLYPAANLACFYALGLYQRDVIADLRKGLSRLPLAAGSGALAAALAAALLGSLSGPVEGGSKLLGAALACFLASGTMARLVFCTLRRQGLFRPRLLVVGAGRRAWDLVWMLRKEGRSLNYEVAFLDDPALGEVDARLADGSAGRIISASAHGILGAAHWFGADQIVVAPDERRGMALETLLDCKIAGFPITQYLSFVEKEIRRVDLKRMELSWLLYSDGFYFSIMDRFLKRSLDIAVSSVLLLLFTPFLAAAILAIKLDDRGPALYRQERVTKAGRSFAILKLRTMRVDAERGGAVWAAKADARVTRVGALLRRTRIDEMPQLCNVLRGDMSLVGPRPERPAFVQMLAKQIPLYDERHVVKAGLTGWAQINYPYGASTDDARSKLSYDLYYVKNFSVVFDLLIILQTIRVVLWPGGVR